jgi:hypothetical protein
MHLTFQLGAIVGLVSFAGTARAEEGMWTFDNLPVKQLQEKYHFAATPAWLDHVRLSSVRLNDGGSGSFVSPHGLLLTNHHVARGQLQKNSTPENDYISNGFYAATPDQEMKSPDLEVNVLVSMEEVTERVRSALKQAKSPGDQFKARKSTIAEIERESLERTGLRPDVVTLYQGGEYWLYRYKKYTDVRIVFAPEQQIAYFGGDPDNFTYPRYDLDLALFRVYEDGKPIDSKQYLRWNSKGVGDGDLVFVSGHPGSTARLDTIAQLAFERDIAAPTVLKTLKQRIATLREFSALGRDQTLEAGSQIFNLENSKKAYEGRLKGLQDPAVFGKKQKEEEEFKARVTANPQWKTAYGNAWQEISEAEKKSAPRAKEQYFRGLDSTLATFAAQIVQYVAEVKKPDGERLPGYHDSQLDSLRFRLLSKAPIYRDLEIARMSGALELNLSELGANDPFLKMVLNGKSSKQAAAELVNGTKLTDADVRKQLLEGGEAAVAASEDPLIVLARKLDPMRRELIKWYEQNVSSVEERAGEQLGRARFEVYGKTIYPDATFSLRLSYGQVKGYPMNGTIAPSKTTLFGLFDRANSFDFGGAFDLPARYKEGRGKLDLATPMNFVTTNDIIGGNSGSPVINRDGDLVGLIFDGNIESLVGDFVYDIERNRAVAVHTGAMTEALRKLYGAEKLLQELLQPETRQ